MGSTGKVYVTEKLMSNLRIKGWDRYCPDRPRSLSTESTNKSACNSIASTIPFSEGPVNGFTKPNPGKKRLFSL